APAAVYQPAPYAPPVGNAFTPPPLPGGFAAPPPQQVRPQTVAPQATMPETTVPQTTVVQPPLPQAPAPQTLLPQTAVPPPAAATEGSGKVPPNEEILAYVGPEVILMGDVLPDVEFSLKQVLKGKTAPPPDQMEKIRESWIRGRLKHTIEVRQTLVFVKQKI